MGMFSSHLTPCRNLCSAFSTMWELLRDGLQFLRTISHSRAALAAEILFLRKQLAYYQAIGSDRADSATPPGCACCFGLACSIGRQRSWSSRRVLLFVGIAKVSGCTGDGSREVAICAYRKLRLAFKGLLHLSSNNVTCPCPPKTPTKL